MTITLTKGQALSLAKNNPGLTRVFMGLGWDPAKPASSGGFLGRFLGGGGSGSGSIDLDASVIVFDAAKTEIDTVYFGTRGLTSKDGAIRHGGDNLTGEGDGDDETIHVDLSRLDPRAAHLVFTVSSYRGQTFNQVDNAVARLVDETTDREICSFTLREQGAHTGVIMASLSKGADGWTMTAHGVSTNGKTVQDLSRVAKSVL